MRVFVQIASALAICTVVSCDGSQTSSPVAPADQSARIPEETLLSWYDAEYGELIASSSPGSETDRVGVLSCLDVNEDGFWLALDTLHSQEIPVFTVHCHRQYHLVVTGDRAADAAKIIREMIRKQQIVRRGKLVSVSEQVAACITIGPGETSP